MVKISADLISRSSQFLNPVKEFQLDLRGYKITVIENLTATNDQFGCIDFTDNSITKMDQLPKLNRLRTLLIINNRVSKVEPNFAINCPYLENLILTNNKVNNINYKIFNLNIFLFKIFFLFLKKNFRFQILVKLIIWLLVILLFACL